MNEYLLDALSAFQAVPDAYFNTAVDDNYGHGEQEEARQRIERVFTSEFYHQWRCIMEQNQTRYQNLILHTEIGKRLGDGERSSFPDLALHGGQIGPNRFDNKVLVEIKMNEFDNNDLRKLISGISYLNYERGLYLIPAMCRNQIEYSVAQYPELNLLLPVVMQIYFVTNSDNLFCLGDILNP